MILERRYCAQYPRGNQFETITTMASRGGYRTRKPPKASDEESSASSALRRGSMDLKMFEVDEDETYLNNLPFGLAVAKAPAPAATREWPTKAELGNMTYIGEDCLLVALIFEITARFDEKNTSRPVSSKIFCRSSMTLKSSNKAKFMISVLLQTRVPL